MSRSERRHHEERIKAKRRRIARFQSTPRMWVYRWEWRREPDGSLVGRCVVDPRGVENREAWIVRTGAYRAHHNKCPCWHCRRPRYDRNEDRRVAATIE
jgi:hypothetical protein